MVKGLPASPLLQTRGRRPDNRAANGARGLMGLLMIALSSLALIILGRLNRIMNAVVPASLVRGMMAEEAIVRFEGSLVVARVLGDNSAFERVLKLPSRTADSTVS